MWRRNDLGVFSLPCSLLPLLRAEFEEEEDPANKSFFSEIIASISDIKFSRDGRYILSRDYLSLKEWDLRMENRYTAPRYPFSACRASVCL